MSPGHHHGWNRSLVLQHLATQRSPLTKTDILSIVRVRRQDGVLRSADERHLVVLRASWMISVASTVYSISLIADRARCQPEWRTDTTKSDGRKNRFEQPDARSISGNSQDYLQSELVVHLVAPVAEVAAERSARSDQRSRRCSVSPLPTIARVPRPIFCSVAAGCLPGNGR